MEINKFNELEGRIKSVIEDYSQLKIKSRELEESLNKKEEELEEANNRIRILDGERNSVRTKVDSLLEILQDVNIPQ